MVGRLARPASAPGDPGRCQAGEGDRGDGLRPLAGGVHVRRHRGRGGPGVAQGASGRCPWASAGWSPATRPTTSCRCGSTGSPTGSSAATPTCRSSGTRRSWAGRSSGRRRPRRPSMTCWTLQAVFNHRADVVPALAAGQPRAGPGDEGPGRADAEEAGRVPGRPGSAAGHRGGGTGSRSRTARGNFTGSPAGCSIAGATRTRSSWPPPTTRRRTERHRCPGRTGSRRSARSSPSPERGTMMGNRGVLHDDEGRIRRPWQVRRWILCLLEFRGRHRAVMAPDRYTELFFLDEATGLAAGHRPCAECRRARFLAFRDAWASGNHGDHPQGDRSGRRRSTTGCTPSGSARIARSGPSRASLDELPDGVFVAPDGPGGEALPDPRGRCFSLWSPGATRGDDHGPGAVR